MERQGEAAASDRAETGADAHDETPADDAEPSDGDGSGGADEPHRMVEAGVGADVPIDDGDGEADGPVGDDGTGESAAAEPDGGAPSSEPQAESAVADDGSASPDDDGADDADATADDVPPELRDLLAEGDADESGGSAPDDAEGSAATERDPDPADRETAAERSGEESTRERTSDRTDGRDRASEPDRARASAGRAEGGSGAHEVSEHRPAAHTELTRPDDASRIATPEPEPEEESEPAPEAEPVSVRSEMSPALAERQAFVALLVALGAGGLFATLGNVLRLTRWQTLMVLVTAGIVVLLIATFVVFRAMLAAAERNDEPYRTAYTHPLFMFLFIVTTTVTALFVGYVSRLVT